MERIPSPSHCARRGAAALALTRPWVPALRQLPGPAGAPLHKDQQDSALKTLPGWKEGAFPVSDGLCHVRGAAAEAAVQVMGTDSVPGPTAAEPCPVPYRDTHGDTRGVLRQRQPLAPLGLVQ